MTNGDAKHIYDRYERQAAESVAYLATNDIVMARKHLTALMAMRLTRPAELQLGGAGERMRFESLLSEIERAEKFINGYNATQNQIQYADHTHYRD